MLFSRHLVAAHGHDAATIGLILVLAKKSRKKFL